MLRDGEQSVQALRVEATFGRDCRTLLLTERVDRHELSLDQFRQIYPHMVMVDNSLLKMRLLISIPSLQSLQPPSTYHDFSM